MDLIIDIGLLLFLAITIFFPIRLSRQLNELKANEKNLKNMIMAFDNSTNKAKLAVQEMATTATEAAEDLQLVINKGRELSGELNVVIGAGDSLGTRLENLAVKDRPTSNKKPIKKSTDKPAIKTPQARSTKKPIKKENNKTMSKAEMELMQALKDNSKAS